MLHNRGIRGHSTMRQNWFPLLVWSSSLVPITRPWLIRQQKFILSNSDFAFHFKSIHKIRMQQNSEIKHFYIARRKAPLCQRLQIMWNSPKHPLPAQKPVAHPPPASGLTWESIQHEMGEKYYSCHTFINRQSICSPLMNKPRFLSHLCESSGKEIQMRNPHTHDQWSVPVPH